MYYCECDVSTRRLDRLHHLPHTLHLRHTRHLSIQRIPLMTIRQFLPRRLYSIIRREHIIRLPLIWQKSDRDRPDRRQMRQFDFCILPYSRYVLVIESLIASIVEWCGIVLLQLGGGRALFVRKNWDWLIIHSLFLLVVRITVLIQLEDWWVYCFGYVCHAFW